MPCNQFPCTAALCLMSLFLLQVELLRSKRGTRFYRGEPDRQPARRTLLIIHVEKSSPSFDTSCEPHHTSVCLSSSHHNHHHPHILLIHCCHSCVCVPFCFCTFILCYCFYMSQLCFVCFWLCTYYLCLCVCVCVCFLSTLYG